MAQILREAKICIPHPAAVLLALAVPLCSYRMLLRKARKRIFRGAFVRERSEEKSDKLLEALRGGFLQKPLVYERIFDVGVS